MNVLLDPAAKLVIAHRGHSAFSPENTLHSFDHALHLGADALECDVHVSRDGHAVIIHDATLERTTNGTGPVNACTLAELQRFDAGYRFTRDGGATFPFRGRGVTIPTLDQVLTASGNVPIILEIKTRNASLEVKRVLTAAGAAGRVLLGAFDDAAIAPFRGSGFTHSASRRELVKLYARALLPGGPSRLPFMALAIPPSFRGIPIPVMRFARMARRAGLPTHVWTIDEPYKAHRYWSGAVSGIITNDPAMILASVGRGNFPSVQLKPSA